jgi:hypothetical protein
MVGFPYETEKSLRDTVKAMKKAYCDYLVYSIFTPYPGTEAFEFCKKEGMIGNNYDVSLYNHQSPLNHFSVYINPEKFRHLASRIEKMVDRKNSFSMERERMLFNLRWRLAVIKKAYNKLGLIATIKKIFIALFVKIKNTFIKK